LTGSIGLRNVATVGGFVLYIAGGWVLITHLLSGREPTAAPITREVTSSAEVSVTVHVIDGPTLHCVTSAGHVAGDAIMVSANAVPELFRQLNCWDPSDT
jgi:hypothetical protein